MRWYAHLAVAFAVSAPFGPSPLVFAGAVAPDLLERFGPIRHRTTTHVLLYWAVLTGGSLVFLLLATLPFLYHLFWFFLGGLIHVISDALTPAGVPLTPRSPYRMTLLGGRIRTGSQAELFLAGAALILALLFRPHIGFFQTAKFSCYLVRGKWCEAGQEKVSVGGEEVFLASPEEVRRHRFEWF